MGRLSEYVNGRSAGSRAGAGGAGGGGDRVSVEVNEALIDQHRRAMARLLVSDPETRKRLKAVIREELKKVRKNLTEDERTAMKNDPRKAYLGVRYTVYRRVLGGNTSILSSRKAGARGILIQPGTLQPGQRGGNRRKVDTSTKAYRLNTYLGKDRGFILRFLNSGTVERGIKFEEDSSRESVHRGSQGGNLQKYGKTINTGNRGHIEKRGTFETNATRYMDSAAHIIADAFAEEFETAYNEEMKQ